jgi:Bucentaur or craniofacial development
VSNSRCQSTFLINFHERDDSEIVEVPEDSTDAKKWPLWKPPENIDAPTPDDSPSTPTPSIVEVPPASSSSVASAQSAAKRSGRRKPKVQLADLPSADSRKGKKLTTLEKSALDWKAHVTASGEPELTAELEANRRGGGYLEKVEFLQRVGDRKNQTFDANKDLKRRRG